MQPLLAAFEEVGLVHFPSFMQEASVQVLAFMQVAEAHAAEALPL